MRYLAILLLLLSTVALAKDRKWFDAHLTNISDETRDGGVMVMPIGTALAGVPMSVHFVYYRFETDDMLYVLAMKNKKPLNVTLRGTTKLSLDGENGFLLDDGGKEKKLQVVSKAVKPK